MNITFELNIINLILFLALLITIFYFTTNSCTLCDNNDFQKMKNFLLDIPKKLINNKEGFNSNLEGSNINFNMSIGVPGDRWLLMQDKNLEKDNKNMYDELKDNVGGKTPLPEGEMNFFYNNKFDAKCCFKPNLYSTGNGCVCLSEEQVKYISNRGGNHN